MKIQEILNYTKAFFEIIRVRNCLLGFVGVMLGALLVSQGNFSVLFAQKTVFAGLAAAFILGAGNAINDYSDYEIDKINRPNRPLPSKRISRSDALMMTLTLFLLGLALSKAINRYCLYIAIFNTVLLVLYAVYSKKVLFLSNLTVSYLVGSIFIFGALSTIDSGVNPLTLPGIQITGILSICAGLMTISREIVKDIEDIEGDKKSYSLTLPIHFGAKTAKKTALVFTIAAVLLSLLPMIFAPQGFDTLKYLIFIGVADISFLFSFTMHPSLAQQVMVAGMAFSLMGFYAGFLL
ncbi:MAG: UbiA family prenyltransferase [Candidatus Altiarchaeota archaeon]